MNESEVRESIDGDSGITLVHIPTGCNVHVNSSAFHSVNRAAAMRLLYLRVAQLVKVPKGRKIF